MPINFFYLLKPFIPRSLQLYLRRKIIYSKLQKYRDIWPILKGSEKKPENWKGWPGSKKFALIFTHDVENKNGYSKVLKLMKFEKELGFVSSFNFVPESDYKVDTEMLDILIQNGFEYGVHGLKHDGKLFSSKREFFRRANKINQYLTEWGTVGFRAPAMHHNLDLIGVLNIEYDLSTFDTDPFEPQPDGVGTIFPFWVQNSRHRCGGYVEMPYTLPQDFTPFILMGEKTPQLWINKLEWISENGGMVLVNVHPDYINFDGIRKSEEYSLEIYRSFLTYILTNHIGEYWNVTPKELALFWKKYYK